MRTGSPCVKQPNLRFMHPDRRSLRNDLSRQMCIHWVHFQRIKDAGLRIRVQRELRESFVEACKAQDKPAAQVLREFMRDYVRKQAEKEKDDLSEG